MMTAEPIVSILISTRNRLEALWKCINSALSQRYSPLEVLVLDDCSQERDICAEVSKHVDDSRVLCFSSTQHLGVAGSRNFLMQKARGEILVCLDDDAVLEHERCVELIVERFLHETQLGIIAFRIIDHQPQGKDVLVPFSRRQRKVNPSLERTQRAVSYFNGGGHAVHRRVVDRCGLYVGDLMYSAEELDLAYRVIRSGMWILYCPDIVAHHYPRPSVVDGNGQAAEFYYSLRNRFWIAYKFLPYLYLVTYLTIWTIYYGLVALRRGQVRKYLRGIRDGLRGVRRLERRPLERSALTYLKRNFGRLWY